MSRAQWGLVVFGPVFMVWLALELTAVFWEGCPWPTLSRLCWDGEDAWPPLQIVFLIFLAALLVHIVARAPLWVVARWRP